MWQSGEHSELSQRAGVLSIDPQQPLEELQGSCTLKLQGQGTVHGVCLWVDFGSGDSVLFDGSPKGKSPTPVHQAVILLHEPLAACGLVVQVHARLCPATSMMHWTLTDNTSE